MAKKRDEHCFELRVLPQGGASYGLALFQPRPGPENGKGRQLSPVVRVSGDRLKLTTDQVLQALKRCGYRSSDLRQSRREPFYLSEEEGVRLGLLFLSIRPLRKLRRMEAVSQKIREMTPEELYYWYSKTTSSEGSSRAQRALRVLMAEE